MAGCKRVRKCVGFASGASRGSAARVESVTAFESGACIEPSFEGFVFTGLENALFPEDGRKLTVSQVEKLTGVTVAALRHYDKMGLLCPGRTGDFVANNRKLYGPDDLSRLQSILVLREYGFELSEIGFILDGEGDLRDVLACKLRELRRRARALRNLILFTKFVGVADDDDDLLEGLANGPACIDVLADAARGTQVYEDAMQGLAGRIDEDAREALHRLDAIVDEFSLLDDSEGFGALSCVMSAFCDWWNEFVMPIDELGYLGFWAVFEDHALIPERMEDIGGCGTPGFFAMSLFYVQIRLLMESLSDSVCEVARLCETDVIAAIEGVGLLAEVVCERMAPWAADPLGLLEVSELVLTYVESVLGDEELRALLQVDGFIGFGSVEVEAVLGLLRMMRG